MRQQKSLDSWIFRSWKCGGPRIERRKSEPQMRTDEMIGRVRATNISGDLAHLFGFLGLIKATLTAKAESPLRNGGHRWTIGVHTVKVFSSTREPIS